MCASPTVREHPEEVILIVRGHISSGEAKYAISLWKMFEPGSARSYASGVTSWGCRKRSLPISVGSIGPMLEGLNGASATSGWLTSRSWPGLLKSLFRNSSAVFVDRCRGLLGPLAEQFYQHPNRLRGYQPFQKLLSTSEPSGWKRNAFDSPNHPRVPAEGLTPCRQ